MLQSSMGASKRHMCKLSNFLRAHAGRASVPKDYKLHLYSKSNLLADIYDHGIYEFDVTDSKLKSQRPVIWADAEKLLDAVLQKRNVIGKYSVKVMADGGQGFLKICLSILTEDFLEKSDEQAEPDKLNTVMEVL